MTTEMLLQIIAPIYATIVATFVLIWSIRKNRTHLKLKLLSWGGCEEGEERLEIAIINNSGKAVTLNEIQYCYLTCGLYSFLNDDDDASRLENLNPTILPHTSQLLIVPAKLMSVARGYRIECLKRIEVLDSEYRSYKLKIPTHKILEGLPSPVKVSHERYSCSHCKGFLQIRQHLYLDGVESHAVQHIDEQGNETEIEIIESEGQA